MPYSFRLRCNLGKTCCISSDEAELVIASSQTDTEDVVLRAIDAQALRDARRLEVRGRPYESEEIATAAGQRWRKWVETGFARLAIGADFGDRAATGWPLRVVSLPRQAVRVHRVPSTHAARRAASAAG